jgi:Flp pilus assembly pilin Flp
MKHPFGAVELQRGQGMTEYIVIVALIAVAAIAVYQLFGQTVRSQTAGIALELSGQSAQPAIGTAQQAATQANTAQTGERGLSNYNHDAAGGAAGNGGAN